MLFLNLIDFIFSQTWFYIFNFLKIVNHLYKHVAIKDFSSICKEDCQIHFVNDDEVDFSASSDIIENDSQSIVFASDENNKKIKMHRFIDDFDGKDPLSEFWLPCNETTLVSKNPHAIVKPY